MSCPSGYIYNAATNMCDSTYVPPLPSVPPKGQPVPTPGKNPDGTPYSPELNNWVGYITAADVERENKLIALGPSPPGLSGTLEGLVLLLALKKLAQTPEGLRVIRDLGVQYLKSMATIMSTLSQSSSAHVISCAMNQYVACTIYQRMGMMSAHDAVETRSWLDHQVGEALKVEYTGQSLGALTTLVNSTTTQEAGEPGAAAPSAAGLGAIAKILTSTAL